MCVLMYFMVFIGLKKNKDMLERRLKVVFGFGNMAMCAQWMIALFQNELAINLLFSVFFVGASWSLYFFLEFCLCHTGRVRSKLMSALAGVLALDSLSILLNAVTGHAFDLAEKVGFDGSLFFRYQTKAGLYVHFAICYSIVAFGLFLLVREAAHTPSPYCWRFWIPTVLIFTVVVINGIMLVIKPTMSWEVLSYPLVTVGCYCLIKYYLPRRILDFSMHTVPDAVDAGVFLFDMIGQCKYMNSYAKELFGEGTGDLLGLSGGSTVIIDWLNGRNIRDIENGNYQFEHNERTRMQGQGGEVVMDETHYYNIRYSQTLNRKNEYIGCFLVIVDITESMERIKISEYNATHDKLTGLYNKEHFCEVAEKTITEHEYERYILVCSDIADFKLVNEVFGKEMGDDILAGFATYLRKSAQPGDVFGRIGGDRFAILMPKRRYHEQDFIMATNEILCKINKSAYSFVCYVGAYEIVERVPVDIMCDRALMALHKIKRDHTVAVAYYDENQHKKTLFEQRLTGELPQAIEQGQIKAYVQPQVDRDGNIMGGECLVRWLHPEHGMISPGQFIPVFEKNGLITIVDRHIWRLACAKLREWHEQGRDDLYLSVNISARDIRLLDIFMVFTDLVAEFDISPKNLKLEITESAVVDDMATTIALIKDLQRFGFTVEMDDFGSAYSSLNMLKDIPVDVLKIDLAFLRKSDNRQRGRDILDAVVHMADKLQLETVVEGVEDKDQLDFMDSLGCKRYQGYYFARPMPMEEFEEKLSTGLEKKGRE